MPSEKIIYNEADNQRSVTPPQNLSMAESVIDLAHEKKIMCAFQCRFLSTSLIIMMRNIAARLTFASFRFSRPSIQLL